MNGQRCLADFDEKALVTLLTVHEAKLIQQLAQSSPLARIASASQTLAEYEQTARECGKRFESIRSPNAYAAAASRCLLDAGMAAPNDRELLACVSSVNAKSSDALLGCVRHLVQDDRLAKVNCVIDQGNDPLAMVMCGTETTISPQARRCINEYRSNGSKNAVVNCLSAALPGRVQHVPECLNQPSASESEVAICLAAPYLPPKVSAALSCGQQHGTDWKGVAACSLKDDIASVVGGDAGKVIACGIQSGGDYVGTAVCMFGGGLNQTQQVVLQCAATSPDPYSFGVCAVGQLAIAEFMQCREVKFGQGQCFGRNNEIRRFIRNIGLGDMDENHPISRIMNVKLDILKFQVAFAEDAAKFIADVGGAVIAFGGQVLHAATHVIREALKITGDLISPDPQPRVAGFAPPAAQHGAT